MQVSIYFLDSGYFAFAPSLSLSPISLSASLTVQFVLVEERVLS